MFENLNIRQSYYVRCGRLINQRDVINCSFKSLIFSFLIFKFKSICSERRRSRKRMKTILDNYRKILFSLGRFYTLLQMLCQPCRSQRDYSFASSGCMFQTASLLRRRRWWMAVGPTTICLSRSRKCGNANNQRGRESFRKGQTLLLGVWTCSHWRVQTATRFRMLIPTCIFQSHVYVTHTNDGVFLKAEWNNFHNLRFIPLLGPSY